MKELYFTPEFLGYIVVPEATVRHLNMESRFPSDLVEYTPKRLTMHPGYRNYSVGEIVRGMSSDGMWHLPLRITEVEHKSFGEVTMEEAQKVCDLNHNTNRQS